MQPLTSTASEAAPSSTMERARDRVMEDLVQALIYEKLFGIVERGSITEAGPPPSVRTYPLTAGESWFRLPLNRGKEIWFRVKDDPRFGGFRLSRLPVFCLKLSEGGEDRLSRPTPAELVRLLLKEKGAGLDSYPNVDGFCEELETAVFHTALSMEAEGEKTAYGTGPFLEGERRAALRDRPFHPTAKAKVGWSESDCRQYAPEWGRDFGLDWIAVARDRLRSGGDFDPDGFAEVLLTSGERQELKEAASRRGIDPEGFALLPVHPWQKERVLPGMFEKEMAEGKICTVAQGVGRYRATSSLRSLAPAGGGDVHVKLPLGVGSLSALRILPPRYLDNGEKAEAVMRGLCRQDPLLKKRVRLCGEGEWSAWQAPGEDLFADKPGHLAAQIRRYPSDLAIDPEVTLLPMAALAADDREGGLRWVKDPLVRFRELCDRFFEVGFLFAGYGVMPELHGQNVVLILRGERVEGLLLRDHDTLRIHRGWMERAGVSDPGYTVKPGTRNTLILPTPEDMVSYLVTLGIQVNLYAIADANCRRFGMEEEDFWRGMEESARDTLSRLPLRDEVHSVIERVLFQEDVWPFKQILTPLLRREGTGGGSMPSGTGSIPNPFRRKGKALR
ncbi:IucA/IucC family protein [Salinithrix halophila]|uniref:IucA/IucC family protein n=1 Tax=Salinithrix halophila TaxID=1485204 RepID=A0ABV8JAR5_9BACL